MIETNFIYYIQIRVIKLKIVLYKKIIKFLI